MPRFKCSSCEKTFARHSHLDRHQEIHRARLLWPCSYCESSFTRRDTLNRHLSRCAPGVPDVRVPSVRINRSCQSCTERKVKCSRGQPCQRCVSLDVSCHYLIHGSARQRSSPPPLPDMSTPPLSGTSSTGNVEITDSTDSLDQQHVSPGFDSLVDPVELNPWLSWGWSGTPWDFLESGPAIPLCVSDEQIMNDQSFVASALNIQNSNMNTRAVSIINARIDPAEHHRQTIIAYLQRFSSSSGEDENVQWLIRSQFTSLLKTYFTRHHRHTPIIHLPTFDIVECPTSLTFALALIAASYMPELGLRAHNIVILIERAYKFALEADENLYNGGVASLGTLQALLLLGILDRLMVVCQAGSHHRVRLDETARLARAAHIFEVPSDPPGISWRDWAVMESRRRLGLVLFAFDAFISVLHDESPNVRADELNVRFPRPEFMFAAFSEAEWKNSDELRSHEVAGDFSVSMTLSSLCSNMDQPLPFPNTLMGRFILLHSILQHAWRTKRIMLENGCDLSDPKLQTYLESKAAAIHQSLRQWRVGWPEDLLDFEPLPECPSLYQDRAEAYCYLAGIIILPQVVIASPNIPTTNSTGALSIHRTLECLMILSDQSKLQSSGHDFDASYRLVTEQNLASMERAALSTLVYRETDRTMAGFTE